MKNILKSILFIAVFVVSGLTTQNVFADSCIVNSTKFEKISPSTNFVGLDVTLLVQTSNCDEGINLKLKAIKSDSEYLNNRINYLPDLFLPDANGLIKLELETEEGGCYSVNENLWGYECISYIEIYSGENKLFSGNDQSNITPVKVKKIIDDLKEDPYNEAVQTIFKNRYNELLENGVIVGSCAGNCGFGNINEYDEENWDYKGLLNGSLSLNTNSCNITEGDVYFTNFEGNYIDNKTIKLNIKTDKCHNIPLDISIVEEDPAWTFGDSSVDIDLPSDVTVNSIIITPIEDLVEIPLMANKSKCDNSNPDPDCRLFVNIKYNNKEFSTESHLDDYSENSVWKEDKSFLEKGVILAYCDLDVFNNSGACSSGILTDAIHWKLLGEPKGTKSLLQENETPELLLTEQTFEYDSPCINETKDGYIEGCYEFLAPIPGISKNKDKLDEVYPKGHPKAGEKIFEVKKNKIGVDSSGNAIYEERIAIKDIRDYQLGDYINKLFQIAVAILGVISVIMIVVAGVQYMTVDSIYGKSDARSRITGAVGGLILALGIYTILWTINPQLLEVNFGSNIDEVSIEGGPVTYGNDGSVLIPTAGGGKSEWILKGGKVKKGDNWAQIKEENDWVDARPWLISNGFKINKSECVLVGDVCTSTYFEEGVWDKLVFKLQKLKEECPDCTNPTKNTNPSKDWIITGGSEAWLHSTHGPDKAVLDMVSVNPKLNEYLGGKESFIGGCTSNAGKPKNGTSYIQKVMPEDSSCPTWNPAPHWHIWFKD